MRKEIIKIIVAGGHQTSLMQMVILLRRLGYEVVPAENGAEVLSIMEQSLPALVILDGHLPAKDGVSTSEFIKKHPEWCHIPVVMMAERYSKTCHDEYIRFGYAGLLTTPLDLQKMHILIQEFLAPPGGKIRQHLRTPFNHKVQLSHRGRTEKYWALNLSQGGIYLRTQAPLSIGSEVAITLIFGSAKRLEIPGVVIYHRGTFTDVFKVDPGMAIEFRDAEPEASSTLASFISDMLIGDLKRHPESIVSR